ncbi:MAG TPA: hypothetical protein VG456_04635 [Candidatus Sulfopaludibacter sp.]|jgi:hypothetical protein|nr:hypothetical protein [Candidatus Sulfopaludibacter sp.]
MIRGSIAGLLAGLGLYAALRSAGFYGFTGRETEGLAILLQVVGDIYAVLLAFVIFVIWGQFTEVADCVMRECDSLTDVQRFSNYLDAESHAAIRRALSNYAAHVLRFEWDALGDGRADPQAEIVFSKLVASVVEANPQTDAQRQMHGRLIDMVREAGMRRGERVSKSLTRIPPTLVALVNTIAGALLFLVFLYPFHTWYMGGGGFLLVGALLLLANFVMMDTDNPLKGAWNVSPEPFNGLKT